MHGKRFFCALLVLSVCVGFVGCKPSYVASGGHAQATASPSVIQTPEPVSYTHLFV